MKVIVNAKKSKGNEEVYNVIPEVYGVGTVIFLADIPKSAIVTGLFINGKSIEDYCLDSYRIKGERESTIYPRNEYFDGLKVVAMYICETCGCEIYNLATSNSIEEFVVEYIDIAVAEV